MTRSPDMMIQESSSSDQEVVISSKKLIEIALPLDDINAACAREKSIRQGHPASMHLWWARRPLAAARAVLFAQLVDDPSTHPDIYPTDAEQEKERGRLFRLIRDLIQWENSNNEELLEQARLEIAKSWRSTPKRSEFGVARDTQSLPAFHDIFAGGGTLPLEAQRLGLCAFATDLNPVAVIIEKAMIEIAPLFRNAPPVNRRAGQNDQLIAASWHGSLGLADDVRYYGERLRDLAAKRIGSYYQPVTVTKDLARGRADLHDYIGRAFPVIAWIWVRTVKSPNPAFADADVPLISNFILSKKAGKEIYIAPVISGNSVRLELRAGALPAELAARKEHGTKATQNGFICCYSGTPIPFTYIDEEANAGRMSQRLIAAIIDGPLGRLYVPTTEEMESLALSASPAWQPDIPTRGTWASNSPGRRYGFRTFGDYFSKRQLLALTTFCDLLPHLRNEIVADALAAGRATDMQPLRDGGSGAFAYAEAITTYLALTIDKAADYNSTLCGWISGGETLRSTFGRQAITMSWDYCEANILGETTGSIRSASSQVARAIENLPSVGPRGFAWQQDAQTVDCENRIISTDPPYYDNIAYADLSDFFYAWLRPSLRDVFPGVLATVATPKDDELIASAYRRGSSRDAADFFLTGMTKAMAALARSASRLYPVTIYYAFKQTQTAAGKGTGSTGWETFLDAVIRAKLTITGTWPIRTERGGRSIEIGSNALASSIVLVCRPRTLDAPTITQREFIATLRQELPPAIKHLQAANIAPVDIAQAAIGPGMAVYSRFEGVLDLQGGRLSVGEALTLINDALDEVLAEQDSDFDSETRWALAWFEQFGFDGGDYGTAEMLTKAKVTSVDTLARTQLILARGGKVRLLRPDELASHVRSQEVGESSIWRLTNLLINALDIGGESAAASILKQVGSKGDTARELAYRLYVVSDRKKRPRDAMRYNALIQSWAEIMRLASEETHEEAQQSGLFG